MEEFGIRKNNFVDTGTSGTNGRDKASQLEGLQKSFQDLVSKAGNSFNIRVSGLADSSSVNSLISRNKTTDYAREQPAPAPYATREDYTASDNNRRDNPSVDNVHPESSNVVRPEYVENSTQPSHSPTDADPAGRAHEATDNAGANSDSGASENNDADGGSATSGTASSTDENKDATSTTASSDTDGPGEQATAGATEAAVEIAAKSGNGPLDIAAVLLQGGQARAKQTNQGDAAEGKPGETLTRTNADGVKQSAARGTSANQSHLLGKNAQQTQSGQGVSGENTKDATAIQQQAAELAKTIGSTNKTQVNVSVANDAETLTSKPAASLAAGTVLTAANAKATSQSGAQNNSRQTGSRQNAAQMAIAGQNQVGQQQAQAQQNVNQGAQSQGTARSAGAGTISATGMQGGQATATGSIAGGGESTLAQTAAATASNTAQHAPQTQQSQHAHAQQNSRAAMPGESVVDQVSVKITKALQAGTDRISIQLKPSELGRVDVKLDVGHDGRVLAVVTADNKDTLDLLKRDSSDLQRALEDAGMQLDSGDMSFNLRGEEQELAGQASGPQMQNIDEASEGDDVLDASVIADLDSGISNGRIDVKA